MKSIFLTNTKITHWSIKGSTGLRWQWEDQFLSPRSWKELPFSQWPTCYVRLSNSVFISGLGSIHCNRRENNVYKCHHVCRCGGWMMRKTLWFLPVFSLKYEARRLSRRGLGSSQGLSYTDISVMSIWIFHLYPFPTNTHSQVPTEVPWLMLPSYVKPGRSLTSRQV